MPPPGSSSADEGLFCRGAKPPAPPASGAGVFVLCWNTGGMHMDSHCPPRAEPLACPQSAGPPLGPQGGSGPSRLPRSPDGRRGHWAGAPGCTRRGPALTAQTRTQAPEAGTPLTRVCPESGRGGRGSRVPTQWQVRAVPPTTHRRVPTRWAGPRSAPRGTGEIRVTFPLGADDVTGETSPRRQSPRPRVGGQRGGLMSAWSPTPQEFVTRSAFHPVTPAPILPPPPPTKKGGGE